MSKIRLEDIQTELKEENWKVISTEYQNLNSVMEFQCPEGHMVYTSWGKLRIKRECPVCKQNKYNINQEIIKPKSKNVIRTLALDQASHITGYSIFDDKNLVAYGTFEAFKSSEGQRLHEIKNWVLSMIENWKPDVIGIEGIQYQQSAGITTFQTLARLQGILIDLCIELDIQYMICPTNTWRAYCQVKGKTRQDKKRSMQLLVKNWFDVSVSDDIADAIGIGKYTAAQYQKQTNTFFGEQI